MVTLLLKIFLVIICEMCHGCNVLSYYDTSAANTDASKLHAFHMEHHELKCKFVRPFEGGERTKKIYNIVMKKEDYISRNRKY